MHNHYSEYKIQVNMLTAEFNFIICNNLNKYPDFANSKTVQSEVLTPGSYVPSCVLKIHFPFLLKRESKYGTSLLEFHSVVTPEKIPGPNIWNL